MRSMGIGMGTYLGAADAATEAATVASARAFQAAGGGVFDSAANYRNGRAEAGLGQAFRGWPRERFFVSTKAGYLPMGDGQEAPATWFRRTLQEPGILTAEEVVDGCHALTPRYLRHQLGCSLAALAVDRVDLFHLHNPEHQRPALGPEGFRIRMAAAFETCEALVAEGKAAAYGCATWNGFRVPPEAPDHLSLAELLELAEAAGGRNHHFRWIQLPLSLAMPEAFLSPTQRFGGTRVTALEAARAAGLSVQVSGPLAQGRLLQRLPANVRLPGCATAAQTALQFAASCPGVTTALCGMAQPGHVTENAAVLALAPVPEADLRAWLA